MIEQNIVNGQTDAVWSRKEALPARPEIREERNMGYIEEHKEFYQQILSLLEHHLGPSSEIVLHDLQSPYDRTIIDIRNGHVTGRKIGDCITNLGLEVMRGTMENGDYYNYVTYTKPSNTLRSSTMHIRDEQGNAIGAICINTDITETIKMEEYLKSYNNSAGAQERAASCEEVFPDNIQDILEYLISEATAAVGKSVDKMTKADRLEFLAYLDNKGAFLISKSGDRVCEYLHISKFTLYRYLEAVRGESDGDRMPE